MGVIKWVILTLLVPVSVQAVMPVGTQCSQDPDCLFYMDFKEGQGTVTRDQSRNSLNGTLNGGPLWLSGRTSYTNWGKRRFVVSLDSDSYCPMSGAYLYFSGTGGENVKTPVTSVFDFSVAGKKAFMIMTVIKLVTPDGDNNGFFNWTQGANLCGWSVQKEANTFNMQFMLDVPVSGPTVYYWRNTAAAKMTFTDMRPHSLGIWCNGAGTVDMYYDGKFINRNTGMTDVVTCGGGSALAFSEKHDSGANSNHNQGATQIWGVAIATEQASGFFKAWHEYQFGAGN